MKLMIASDLHGSAFYCRQLLAAMEREQPDKLLLLGDILYHGPRNDLPEGYAPKEVIAMLNPLRERLLCVRGNCDLLDNGAKYDEFLVLENFKLWLTHGHKYIQRQEKADLGYWAKTLDQDIVVYGHTHVPVNAYYGDTLLVNPGSPARPRGGSKPCFAVLTLQRGAKPEVEFIDL